METHLKAESANGPLDQRDDFKDAKETYKRLYQEHTAITGCGNTPIPPQQQVQQRPNQQPEGHEEYSYRLDSSGWKYHVPATMHSSSSPSSWWPPSDSLWSTWNWDSSSWSEQFFFFLIFEKKFPVKHFASRELNLLAIDGWKRERRGERRGKEGREGEGVISTPTAHTSLLSQLFFMLQSSFHALTSRTRVAQAQHEAWRIVSCPKSSHLIAQCHTIHLT